MAEYISGAWRYRLTEDGAAEITGWAGSAAVLDIPNALDGYAVTHIGEEAFKGCRSLTAVSFPKTLKCIGDRAFWFCPGLTELILPEGLTYIGEDAFRQLAFTQWRENRSDGMPDNPPACFQRKLINALNTQSAAQQNGGAA